MYEMHFFVIKPFIKEQQKQIRAYHQKIGCKSKSLKQWHVFQQITQKQSQLISDNYYFYTLVTINACLPLNYNTFKWNERKGRMYSGMAREITLFKLKLIHFEEIRSNFTQA